ncbi:MAG: hypothetical protein HFH87_14295 [Lachnospiraceae bacterium]|nr:hypothetical protein [Lachnospiraceae bacterium]
MQISKKCCLGFLLAGMLLLTGCSFGKKVVLTYDGTFELELGKTKVAELLEAGFTDRYSYDKKSQIDSSSWQNFYAMKEDVTYGTMYAGNKSSQKVKFEQGKVFRVVIDYRDPDYVTGEILINGVNYAGYTREQIKEAMNGAEMTLDSETYLCFEDGKFEYTFQFDEGSETVSSISIDDGTDWKLVIK